MSALPQPLESLGDFDPTPDLDARLNALARRAQTDPAARNTLYAALDFKIDRFVRRYHYRADRLHVCEPEDIAQEGFLVFADLVQKWPGQESFLGYFFSRFPWRLARAIDQLERGWPADRLQPLEAPDDLPPSEPARLDPVDDATLSDLIAGLDPQSRKVLELRVDHGLRLKEIARMLDLDQRAMYSLWHHLLAQLRAALEGRDTGPGTRARRGRRKRA
ncbi:MAG TPA: sigma-70 family RNA polymerase sigma factor [Thermomicrobiaceae bacterium]|nr:sigma-70 family RNA polymerase sigma factor [Thermomicrobiaceae bacterium]